MAPRKGLRVLITNNTLAWRAGSELYVRDIALALLRRGYNPIAYSSQLGEVADELRMATVPVIDDLKALNAAPDLIHGQHHLDAATAMLRFPHVPALYFCHGWLPWEETPPVFPSIVRYIAVDDLCRERLLATSGIAAKKVRMLYNFVDLAKFKPRSPLPDKPASALIFSNAATESNFVGTIRAACQRFGIDRVDVAGSASGNPVAQPERMLSEYDVVFAKARCALEAMAVGCAVIVADIPGLGGMVTSENMKSMRRLNFGMRSMQTAAISQDSVLAEITRYSARDALVVSEWIRADAALDRSIDRLEEYYDEVLSEAEYVAQVSPQAWGQAASDYLRGLAPVIKQRAEADQRAAKADWLASEVHRLVALNWQHEQLRIFQEDPETIRSSRAWRTVSWYRKLRTWLRQRMPR